MSLPARLSAPRSAPAHPLFGAPQPSTGMAAPRVSPLLPFSFSFGDVRLRPFGEISRAEGPYGLPVPAALRERFEATTGATLSDVRLHDDDASHRAAAALGASAFTVGKDIHFAAGEHRPSEPDGQHLLFHELTHAAQQTPLSERSETLPDRASAGAEQEADTVANTLVYDPVDTASAAFGRPITTGAAPALALQPKGKDRKRKLKERARQIAKEKKARAAQKSEDEDALQSIRDDAEIQGAVGDAAELTGIDEDTLEKLIIVESRGKKAAHTGSYYGLMQMGKAAFDEVRKSRATKADFDSLTIKDKRTGADRPLTWDDVKTDPRANVLVGALYAQLNRTKLMEHNADPDAVQIEESARNLYLAHQQGFGGLKKLHARPNKRIGTNQRRNLSDFDKSRFRREGPGSKITNEEFLQAWEERFERLNEIFEDNPAVP